MLTEHLSPFNDSASRRQSLINKHVAWIHRQILSNEPSKILDLGCGPGLYSFLLEQMGHTCHGIDFSPASIEYAKQEATRVGSDCVFQLDDFVTSDYGEEYDLIMMVFSELNTFDDDEIAAIIDKTYQALSEGGKLLMEVPSFDAVYQIGNQPPVWYSEKKGVFSEEPYLCLTESFWEDDTNTAIERYYIIPESGEAVHEFLNRTRAFEEHEYETILHRAGFNQVRFHPSLTGTNSQQLDGMFVIIAEKI
ncbi:class I SAM-dependent methyltransferase [Chloroflexota bacterium]